MITNAQIKLIRALRHKKFRIENNLFVAEGVKTVNALVQNNYPLDVIFATEAYINKHHQVLSNTSCPVNTITENQLEKISSLSSPNEVLALCKTLTHKLPDISGISSQWTIVLQDINDPGNLGTIMRLAHWLNIKQIICSENTVDIYNPKVVQATMGAIAYVKFFYTCLNTFLKTVKGKIPVYSTMLEGESIYETKLGTSGILLMGSESHGISSELMSLSDHKITIPRTKENEGPESLNVSVALAMIGSELLRRNLLA